MSSTNKKSLETIPTVSSAQLIFSLQLIIPLKIHFNLSEAELYLLKLDVEFESPFKSTVFSFDSISGRLQPRWVSLVRRRDQLLQRTGHHLPAVRIGPADWADPRGKTDPDDQGKFSDNSIFWFLELAMGLTWSKSVWD